MRKEPHGELKTSEVYDTLRTMHSLLKDIYWAANYPYLKKKHRNLDRYIAKVDEYLYKAESQVTDF